jgi:pyruvate/2-oxoglutarate/acetoin dehydrogenase E1 component
MVSKGNYELQKEFKQQRLYDLDLGILDNKILAKCNDLRVSQIDVKRSEIKVLSATENLTQDGINLSILKEKTLQLTDGLNFEKSITRINREKLLIQGNKAMLELSQIKAELSESQALFSLKFSSQTAQKINQLR